MTRRAWICFALLGGCEVAVPSGIFSCSEHSECPDDQLCLLDEGSATTKHCYDPAHRPRQSTDESGASPITGDAGTSDAGGRVDGPKDASIETGVHDAAPAPLGGLGGLGGLLDGGLLGDAAVDPAAICRNAPQLCRDGSLLSGDAGFLGGDGGHSAEGGLDTVGLCKSYPQLCSDGSVLGGEGLFGGGDGGHAAEGGLDQVAVCKSYPQVCTDGSFLGGGGFLAGGMGSGDSGPGQP